MDEIDRNILCCPYHHGTYSRQDCKFLLYDCVICDEGGGEPFLLSLESCRECMLDQMHGYEVDRIDGTR